MPQFGGGALKGPIDPEFLGASVRKLLSAPDGAVRDQAAAAAVGHAMRILAPQRIHVCPPADPEETVQSAADLAVAEILKMGTNTEGRPWLPALHREMEKILRRLVRERTGDVDCLDLSQDDWKPGQQGTLYRSTDNRTLGAAYLAAVSGTAVQRFWAEVNGRYEAAGRVQRLVESHIANHPGLVMKQERRGRKVGTHDSDWSRRPIPREGLESLLTGYAHPPELMLDRLAASLFPTEDSADTAESRFHSHGGWVHLRTLCQVVISLLSFDCKDTWGGKNPIKATDTAARRALLRRHFWYLIVGIREGDIGRGALLRGDERIERAFVETAVEMVLKSADLGNPEWDGLSQQDLFCRLAGVSVDEYAHRCRSPLDFLIRRCRMRWRAQANEA